MEPENNRIDKAKLLLQEILEQQYSRYTPDELISRLVDKNEYDENFIELIKKEINKRYKLYANN